MNIADLRKSYEKAELSEDASASDPLKQFERWLNEAIQSEVPEPNAMTVATVASNLRPSTRVVLIKGYDERGIVWYTNYDSRKGQELAGNPFAALQFHWVELERVVRIEGRMEKISDAESDAYFHSRFSFRRSRGERIDSSILVFSLHHLGGQCAQCGSGRGVQAAGIKCCQRF